MIKNLFLRRQLLILIIASQCLMTNATNNFSIVDENDTNYTLTDEDVIVIDGTITSYTAISGITKIIIPETLDGQTVTGIGEQAFTFKSLEAVQLAATIRHIDKLAFNRNNIDNIHIPKNVISIGYLAFGKNSTKTLTFEENSLLTTIEEYAFKDHEMSTLNLPDSITCIASNAFETINEDFYFNLPKGFDLWTSSNEITYTSGDKITETEYTYTAKTYYTLTNEDVIVKDCTIVSCNYNFQSRYITIPDTIDDQAIKSIESGVFSKKYIIELHLPNTLETIGDNAFEDNQIKDLNIPDNVTAIDSGAFASCGITNLDFGDQTKLKSIGDKSFKSNNISRIDIPTDLIKIGIAAFNDNNISQLNNADFDGFFFAKNSDGTTDSSRMVSYGKQAPDSVVIPEGVEILEEDLFRGQQNLLYVQFPSSLTTIGDYAFSICLHLEEVNFGSSSALKTIGKSSFNACKKIKEIDIKECTQLNTINDRAFLNCSALETLDLKQCTALTFIGHQAFYRTALNPVTLPPSTTEHTYIWTDDSGESYIGGADIQDLRSSYTTVKEHIVQFIDWNSTLIATDTIPHGTDATAPASPMREGYTFDAWNTDFSSVLSNISVQAQYNINKYTVSFLNWDNSIIGTDTVEYKGDATAPTNPTRENYTFAQWDTNYTNIMSPLTVKAEYELNTYTVTFTDWDNTVISIDTVLHGNNATSPTHPTREGYTFIGWHTGLDNITDNLIILAQYTSSAAIPETSQQGLKIYPNPAKDMVIIEGAKGKYISVFDLSGVHIFQQRSLSTKEKLDLSNLQRGVYFIKVENTTSRLIIE